MAFGIARVGLSKKLDGGNSNIFYVHPEPWGNDPIWLDNIFQMGWELNHQPEKTLRPKKWRQPEAPEGFDLTENRGGDGTCGKQPRRGRAIYDYKRKAIWAIRSEFKGGGSWKTRGNEMMDFIFSFIFANFGRRKTYQLPSSKLTWQWNIPTFL